MLANQCKKEILDTLPPETQEGKNTFGCYVDGELFVNAKGNPFLSFAPPRLSATYDKKNNSFYIRAYSDKVDFISMRLNETEENIPNPISEAFFYIEKPEINKCWQFVGEEVGEIILTKLDTVNNIASGRFQFRVQAHCLYSSNEMIASDNTIVSVTDGRFDVKLNISD